MSRRDVEEQFARPRWYAVWTRSRQEKTAASKLDCIGIQHFLPLSTEQRQWSDRKKIVDLPLFPGYLFVQIPELSEAQVKVLKIPGIVGFVGNNKGPQAIPDEEIENVRTVLRLKVPSFVCSNFIAGDRVRVVNGILAGVEGDFVRVGSNMKLVLSVAMIQRSIAVNVDACDVEALPVRRTA